MSQLKSNSHELDPAARSIGERLIIERHGQHIQISPDSEVAAPALSTERYTVDNKMRDGIQIVRSRESLLDYVPSRANGGLATILQYHGALEEIEVRIHEHGPRPRPLPELVFDVPIDATDEKFIHFTSKNTHAIIPYALGQVSLAMLIAQVAKKYPSARIAVASGSRKRAKEVARQLRSMGLPVTTPTDRNCPEQVERIVVSTYMGLGHTQVHLAGCDFLFALDATEALAEQVQVALLTTDGRFRLFGFLSLGARLSPWQRDRLMTTFGPERFTIRQHGMHDVVVSVAWLKFGAGMFNAGASTLSLFRSGVWTHSLRNRRIARLAKALDTGNRDTYQAMVPDLARLPLHQPQRVCVLTGSVEHAIALKNRLPGWQLKISPYIDPALFATLRHPQWPTTDSVVTTITGLGTMGPGTIDVILWAGAGPMPPRIPERHLLAPTGVERRLTLIDVRDIHHPVLRQWSRQRREQYQEMEWYHIGADESYAVRMRVERFLASRPGGES